jgi:DNA-binding NtrC family response regulator
LLVDDDEAACEYYSTVLGSASINNIITCFDSREVMPLLHSQEINVILLDLMMPHISGRDLLVKIKDDFPNIPVIMQTAVSKLETAVECMRGGAFDYLVKPIEINRIISVVKRALEHRELKEENLSLRQHIFSNKLEHPDAFAKIITGNESMHTIFRYIESISGTSQPVLITGETGVGKELVAKVIHKLSNRRGPLVTVNIAGLDDNVFSDTLFGHKKGAFTGAESVRGGLVEQAAGGTLFLDEVGDLELASQVKLLRLLQEGEYYPIGSDVIKSTDARIIVATNHNLEQLINEGNFRKDLYYRLTDHQIDIPPLRNRLDDLNILVKYFIEEAALSLEKTIPAVSDSLISLLASYHFPGNVRELKSMIFDAISRHQRGKLSQESFKEVISRRRGTTEKIILNTDYSDAAFSEGGKVTVSDIFGNRFPSMREVEALMIREAMDRTDGNKSVVARMLGLSRPTLNKRIKEMGLIE